MDDIFGDLVPARSQRTVFSETGSKSSIERGPRSTPRPEVPDVFTPEATEEAVKKSAAESIPHLDRDTVLSFSKEQLKDLLHETVQKAVDSTFSKLVRSLRTVLEDMSKRIDATTAMHLELKTSLSDLSEQIVDQASNSNSRFTSVDQALREVDRGVQALRDKAELHEAQTMLAKLSEPFSSTSVTEDKKTPPQAAGAPSGDTPIAAASTAPVAAAVAPAAVAPAASPQIPQIPLSGAAMSMPLPSAPPSGQHQQQQQYNSPSVYPQQLPNATQQEQFASPPTAGVQPPLPPPSGYGNLTQGSYLQAPPPQGPPLAPQASDPYQQQPVVYQAPPMQQQQQPPIQLPPQQMLPPPNPGYGAPPSQMQYAPPPQMQQPPVRPPPMPQGPSMPLPQSYPSPSMPSYPAPLMATQQSQPSFSGAGYRSPQSGQPPPSMQSGPPKTSSRAVPLEQIITDIAQMGFERHQVMTVVNNLQRNGQAVDLNVILDKLTRGDYR